jgi:hypothetical protein
MSIAWDSTIRGTQHLLYTMDLMPIETAQADRITDSINTDGYWLPYMSMTVTALAGASPDLLVAFEGSNDDTNWFVLGSADATDNFTTNTTNHMDLKDDIHTPRWLRVQCTTDSGTITNGDIRINVYMPRLR